MKQKEREQWLSTLQIGDEVAYRQGGVSYRTWAISSIKSITASGRFNLRNGTTINPDGSIRGDKFFYIRPVTAEIRQDIWRRRALYKINSELNVNHLSNEQLQILLDMINAQ